MPELPVLRTLLHNLAKSPDEPKCRRVKRAAVGGDRFPRYGLPPRSGARPSLRDASVGTLSSRAGTAHSPTRITYGGGGTENYRRGPRKRYRASF